MQTLDSKNKHTEQDRGAECSPPQKGLEERHSNFTEHLEQYLHKAAFKGHFRINVKKDPCAENKKKNSLA